MPRSGSSWVISEHQDKERTVLPSFVGTFAKCFCIRVTWWQASQHPPENGLNSGWRVVISHDKNPVGPWVQDWLTGSSVMSARTKALKHRLPQKPTFLPKSLVTVSECSEKSIEGADCCEGKAQPGIARDRFIYEQTIQTPGWENFKLATKTRNRISDFGIIVVIATTLYGAHSLHARHCSKLLTYII